VASFVALLAGTGWQLPGWDEWKYQRAVSGLVRQTQNGREAVIISPETKALSYRWRLGQGWVLLPPRAEAGAAVSVGSQTTGLLELLPQAPAPPFRIKAEIRQDRSFSPFGDLGIYFAHGQLAAGPKTLHMFARGAFVDLGLKALRYESPEGIPGSELGFDMCSFLSSPDEPLQPNKGRSKYVWYKSVNAMKPPGPWRNFVIDVNIDSIHVSLDSLAITEDWKTRLGRWYEDLRVSTQAVPHHQLQMSRQGALGLYISGCSVSLGRFSVEPLRAGSN